MNPSPLLQVTDLATHFFTRDGVVRAVDGLTYSVDRGETLAIVGESGCGKSVSSMSILGLLPSPPARVVGGQILFKGEDLLHKSERQMRSIRGNEISMIFQEPMTSLNPTMTIGRQLAEPLRQHQKLGRRDARVRAIELLQLVGIPEPARRVDEFPYQLSGGMRQRVMIAIALACEPELLIADEPTTALDVTIQAQILDLMRQLRTQFNTAIVLITHDLGVVAEMAQRVVVLYGGKKVEEGPVNQIFANPLHPYTKGLLGAIPHLPAIGAPPRPRQRLTEISGVVPSLRGQIAGCAFAPRCTLALAACSQLAPPLRTLASGHQVACHRAGEPA